ncbi:MAG: TonB-dependent receptor [Bacteroidota bacterium]
MKNSFSQKLEISLMAFLLNAIVINVSAQEKATIQGHIYDATTNENITDAEIMLKPLNKATTTNSEGKFIFKDLDEGKYSIIFMHVGFNKKKEKIDLAAGQNLVLDFSLDPVIKLGEVVITDTLVETFPYTKIEILRPTIQQAAVRDIGDYLRSVPNVSGVRKGGSAIDLSIRGFKFDQLNVRVDGGIRIEGGCPNRMDPTSAHVEIEDIDKVEIIRGPYALKYGPAFGGFVNLITTTPKPFKSKKFEIHANGIWGYESNWNGNKEHIAVTGGNDKVYFLLSGNHKEYGNFKDGNGDLVKSEFRKYNYTAKLGFSPKKNHQFLVTYDDSHGRNVKFPVLPMDERTDDTKVMSFNYTVEKISKTIKKIKFRVFHTDVHHVMDNKERTFSDTVPAVSIIDAYVTGICAGTGLKLGEKGMLMIGSGCEKTYKDGERTKTMIRQYPSNWEVPVKVENLMDATIINGAAFAEYTHKTPLYNFIAAFRVDINSATSEEQLSTNTMGDTLYYDAPTGSEYTNLSFSLGITRKLNEKLSIGFALGRGVRSPNMIERYINLLPIGYDNFDYLGDPEIKPEANHEVDLTVKYNDINLGSVELSGFYSYVTDYITGKVVPPSVQQNQSRDVIGVKQFYNAGYVLLRGFELTYSTPAQYKFGSQIIASYTMATNPLASGYEVDAYGKPTGSKEITNDPLSEIPPFESTIKLHYKLFNNKLIPKVSARFIADQRYVSEAFNESETPGFAIADFAVTYKHNEIVTIAGGVNNILDRAYYEHLNRRIIGSALNYYEPGRVFFVNILIDI